MPMILKMKKELYLHIYKLFYWFSDNVFKANLGKCHPLTNTDENTTLKIKTRTISSSSNQKVLDILFDNFYNMSLHYDGKPHRS